MSSGPGGRTVYGRIFQNFWKSLRISSPKGKIVGEDNSGNTYYEAPPDPHSSRKFAATRWFVPKVEDDWEQNLPPEWEAWLRGRRKIPPSAEELRKNAAIAEYKRIKGAEIQQKADKERMHLGIEPPFSAATKDFPKHDEYEREPGGYTQYEKK